MPKSRQMIFFFVLAKLLVCVEHFMIGAVTDGVDGHAESGLRGFAAMFEEFFAVHVEDAAIIFFANIRSEHRGSMRTERAIHKSFDGAEPEHLVAEAGANAGVLHGLQRLVLHILGHLGAERRDGRRVLLRAVRGDRKVRVLGRQGMPDRVVEHVAVHRGSSLRR